MAKDNLALYVAAYDTADAAAQDWKSLKDAQATGDLKVEGAVVMSRSADGATTEVEEHGSTPTSSGAGIGAIGGLVVGLFAPPLLLTTALGAGIGAGIGALVKHHQEKEIGVDVDEYLPAGSSAVVVVAEDTYLDRVGSALGKATKRISKAIDSDDYDKVKDAVTKSAAQVEDSIES
jgi:uncharacterized membrane protein